MAEILRSRDCIVFFKSASTTVAVSDAMARNGWPGGQGVMWTPPNQDVPTVTYSNGLYGGMLVWGSDENGDDYASITRSQPTYKFATLLVGGNLIATSTYERYTYASRAAGGPLVPLVYGINDLLYFSLRGYWSKENEADIIHAPYAPAFFCGFVAQLPKESNKHFLGIQTSI